MNNKPSLGLIGLGIMGRPMARNLLKAVPGTSSRRKDEIRKDKWHFALLHK